MAKSQDMTEKEAILDTAYAASWEVLWGADSQHTDQSFPNGFCWTTGMGYFPGLGVGQTVYQATCATINKCVENGQLQW